jgi:hypothetical protein
MEDLWEDIPRQYMRDFRKIFGLPVSSNVAILSSMVRKLAEMAGPSSSTIISYPALPGLYQEDIADVATYLGLRMLSGNHVYAPHTIIAAYAGHGMGLCESYTDKIKCTEEGLELPVRRTLLVEISENALLLHTKIMREAYCDGSSGSDVASTLDHHIWSSVFPMRFRASSSLA